MESNGRRALRGRAPTALVAGAGLVMTAAAFLGTYQLERRRAQSEFDALAERPIGELQRTIDLYVGELESVGNLYAASDAVERDEFRAFVKGVIARRGAIHALIWAPQVTRASRATFEAEAARGDYPGFRITERGEGGAIVPAGDRAAYYPLWYVQPYPRERSLYGLDLAVEPGFPEVLRQAADTGQLLTTGALPAPGDPRARQAIGLVLPIYRHYTPATAGVQLRRERLVGFVGGILRTDDLVTEALGESLAARTDLRIADSAGDLIYGPAPPEARTRPIAPHTGSVALPGRSWEVRCTPTARYVATVRPRRAWSALIVGLVLTALAAAYVRALTGRAAWADQLVTERTAALAEANRHLRESEEQYRLLVQTMNEGLSVLDEQGRLTYVNEALLRTLGYAREELLGHSPVEFLDQTNRAILLDQLERRRRGEDAPYEMAWTHKAGHHVHTIISPRPLTDAAGGYRGTFAVVTDVTSLKETQGELAEALEELQRSNRELEAFAYIAPHDLQEPLRKIMAFGDRLEAKTGDALDDRARDYLGRMQSAASRMQGLINDLLTYSRVTTKAQPFTRVDLAVVAQEVVSDLEARIEQVGGRVEIGPLPTIDADSLQMRQLLQNLIGNGLKFHREGIPPIVSVRAAVVDRVGKETAPTSPNALCRLEVSDNGIGFEEKYAERIFGMFQRLHGREEYEGTGVGLAVCRKIAERHGGAIVARSTPGAGTTFIVTLPIHHTFGGASS